MAKRKPDAQIVGAVSPGERESAPQLPDSWPGDARSAAHVPSCFKCGHPVGDVWTESFWSDNENRYVGFCRRCQQLDALVQVAMQEVQRRYFAVAIARIPKKMKPVSA